VTWKLAALILLAVTSGAQSDRVRQDEAWAKKSGLTIAQVHALVQLVGITDTFPGMVSLIDAKSLRQRNHILVTEAGSGHCLRVHVLEPAGSSYREIWMLSELPGPGWPTDEPSTQRGRGICTQSPKPPVVRVIDDGRIEVTVTALADPFQRTLPGTTYVYFWNGTTYRQQQGQ
jgi:hypothetical protein